MEQFKVDAESAKREFDEIVESYDLLLDETDEDDTHARKRILRAIMRGVVYKDDAGFIVMESEVLGKALKFSPLVGAVMKNADQSQSGGDLSQALRILAAMTGTSVAHWAKSAESPRHGEEFKIAQAIAGLLAK